MRKRYPECIQTDGNCVGCALVHHGMDCRNVSISALAWARMAQGMSQGVLAKKSGVSIRAIQEYESGVRQLRKTSVATVMALVTALELDGAHEFKQTLAALGALDNSEEATANVLP